MYLGEEEGPWGLEPPPRAADPERRRREREDHLAAHLPAAADRAAFLGPALWRARKGPFLLVVPASVLDNWVKELKTWSFLRVVKLHGTTKQPGGLMGVARVLLFVCRVCRGKAL